MATYNNLTNIGEYQKTSFPFSSEPLTGGSIYGKMKENEPIILPTTYEDSNGIIEEPKIYETIYYDDNDNKINPPYQNKDTTVFNKDDFSSSLTVTVYNTNDNLTSDQLENTERKFYNNVMSNSNISHEISEETNYNNIINNKSIEIGENSQPNCEDCPSSLILKGYKIKSPDETLDELINENKSIVRFGDGEFDIIFGNNIPFQNTNEKLMKKLNEILQSDEKDLLIGIYNAVNSKYLKKYGDLAKRFWINYNEKNKFKLYKLLNKSKQYYSTQFTRFYYDYKKKEE